MYGGYGTASPPLTNNPFLSSTSQHPGSRFPDISGSTPTFGGQQQQQWGDGSIGGGQYPQQQQQGIYQQPQQYPQQLQTGFGQQQMGIGTGMSSGFVSPGQQSYPSPPPGGHQFQPSSAFGQQLAASVSGSSYGYLNGQTQQQNPTAYNPAQQQLQNNPGYIASLDPYSSIGQGWGDNSLTSPTSSTGASSPIGTSNPSMGIAHSMGTGSTMSSTSTSSVPSGASYGVSPSGDPHPKDYIRTHKSEIEAWDSYAWKQLLSTFEALKKAWENRKGELTARAREVVAQGQMGMQYGGYYAQQIQQEAGRLQGLLKEAESNFDTIAASSFQMQEVFQGYRQSGDQASKRRVREATNAALQGLPTYPPPF
ncbi:hypothetical protein NLJ89_g6758 [Agrocybe chaxingu]|uniref:Uncharacterized protein n=1 Tax=Agrocybe chaxingu TaxID=84603 RepID=A0A9W8JXN2_9AGAR|nr:hypothetical protein NLJ89_g6758 [Agrocybe chaxingu]